MNLLPLIQVLLSMQSQDQPEPFTLDTAALYGATHGWMEGHLAAPGHRFDPDRHGKMGQPPWPAADDAQLSAIRAETLTRFHEGEEPAAGAFAAALGWQAGLSAGMDCVGCAPRSTAHPVAEAIRAGRGQFRFHEVEARR